MKPRKRPTQSPPGDATHEISGTQSGKKTADLAQALELLEQRYPAHQRAITVLMTQFMTAHLRNLYRAFDGDLDLMLVLAEIGDATTRQLGRSMPAERWNQLDRETMEAIKRPCNALSVSTACGMPRETTRRKVAALAKRGWIRRVKGGWVATEAAGEHFAPHFNRETAHRFLRVAKQIAEVLLADQGDDRAHPQ